MLKTIRTQTKIIHSSLTSSGVYYRSSLRDFWQEQGCVLLPLAGLVTRCVLALRALLLKQLMRDMIFTGTPSVTSTSSPVVSTASPDHISEVDWSERHQTTSYQGGTGVRDTRHCTPLMALARSWHLMLGAQQSVNLSARKRSL